MRSAKLILVLTILGLSLCLPFKQQIALANSLEVGREENPYDWTCNGCNSENKPISTHFVEEKAKDIKVILSVYNDYTVLAFRYTATLLNVWQDLLWTFQTQEEFAPKGCKVQREYDIMWGTIREDIQKDLSKVPLTNTLIISGISLGGALACLSFVDIREWGLFENIEVITYGAPHVGNNEWAAWFDSITGSTRIYIGSDPIPFLPICLRPGCTYRQTGTPVVCNQNKEVCTTKCKNQQAVYKEEEPKFTTAELVQYYKTMAATEYLHYQSGEGV